MAGALKTLTTALRETMSLQRRVVGLDKAPVGAFTPTHPSDPWGEPACSGGGPWRITRPIDTTALDPGVLRAAQRSMEALEGL